MGIFYFGLGPNAREKASASLADYYAFALGPAPEGASAAIRELADRRHSERIGMLGVRNDSRGERLSCQGCDD